MNRIKIFNIFLVILICLGLAYGAVTKLTKVALTNSTVDSTVIGGTTPAAGTFTSVTATGSIAASGSVSASGAVTAASAAITNVDSTIIGATTAANGTFTNLKVNTGVTNSGTGHKHVRVGSCTTTTGTFGFCGASISWPGTAFPDTNYTVVCTLDNSSTAIFVGTASKGTSSFNYVIENTNGNTVASTGVVNCIADHD